jgi:hypothetical protein
LRCTPRRFCARHALPYIFLVHILATHTRNTHACVSLDLPACLLRLHIFYTFISLHLIWIAVFALARSLPFRIPVTRVTSFVDADLLVTLILAVRYPPPPASYHADQRRVQHCCCPKSFQHHHCQFAPQFTPQFAPPTARSTSRANFTPPSRPLHVSPPTIGFITALEP